jgi:glycine/D-amino acid oxidase-like deaminating enzyme
MLDAKAMQELTGCRHYMSGLYTPGTVLLQPAGYVRGLGEGLRAHVGVYEHSPVQKITRTGTDWLLETPKAKVTASKVILANNGHLESFGFARGRLMHIFLFATITPDLDAETLKKLGGADRWGVTPADPMGTTMRRIATPQGGNRVITRTCAAFRPEMQSKASDLARAEKVMQQKFDQRYPQLAGMKMDHSWAGHLCLSRNAVTLLGEIEDGMFSACCQNGLGAARGTMTGMAAAELASGLTSDVADHFAQEPEPTRLPPPPFASIGANAVLRLKEWQAGNE